MVRVGIVGSGFGRIGLLPAFRSVPGCRVVAFSTRDSDIAKHLALQGIETISDWKKMVDRSKIDAVAIAVPPDVQYEIAKYAIKRGIHVFAEKPLAANLNQARELLRLAQKAGVTHCIDFMFPEIPAWKKVKEIIDKGTYGKLRHISVNWEWLSGNIRNDISNWKTNLRKGGGALSFYFSHGLHYLEHFGGEITRIKAEFAYTPLSRTAESGFDLLVRFKSGATANVHVSSSAHGIIRHQLSFECEHAVIDLKNENAITGGFSADVCRKGRKKRVYAPQKASYDGVDERVMPLSNIATRFVRGCRDGSLIEPTFSAGVRAQELIEKVRKSV